MDPSAFDLEVLRRLPLAEAALLVLRQACSAQASRELFDRCRGRCYQQDLTFDLFVSLIQDALLRFDGSARPAMQQARDQGRLDVTDPAVYSKLRHVPVPLSEAFLTDASDRLAPLLPDALPSPLPTCLQAFHVQILDGKVTKRLAKRLKVLRGLAGGAIGGKGLVSLHYNTGLVFALAGCPDGDANDAALVPALLERVHTRVQGEETILWLGDAQFADPVQASRFCGPDERHHFLLRYHKRCQLEPEPQAAEALAHPQLLRGSDREGRRWSQEWGWLGAASNKKRRRVRRITLERPGEKPVILITSLLAAAAYPAEELLRAYLGRSSIEWVFQKITEVFSLRRLISSSPRGTVFQLSFCLLLYNVLVVLCSHLAVGQKLALKEVSEEMVFEDVKEELIALARVLSSEEVGAEEVSQEQARPGRVAEAARERDKAAGVGAGSVVCPGEAVGMAGKAVGGADRESSRAAGSAGVGWSVRLAELLPAEAGASGVRSRLAELLQGRWRRIWRKVSNKKRRPHPDKPRARVHSSVQRLLEANKAQKRSE